MEPWMWLGSFILSCWLSCPLTDEISVGFETAVCRRDQPLLLGRLRGLDVCCYYFCLADTQRICGVCQIRLKMRHKIFWMKPRFIGRKINALMQL
ncbi:hypothetical protein I7I48_09987 [Histoplasma ohiense]|nr:hypothetical protein I7I48_09987 [Histoplasma ohiense (nom. inval.)]